MSSVRAAIGSAAVALAICTIGCGSGSPAPAPQPQAAPAPTPSTAATPPTEWRQPLALTEAEMPPIPVTYPMARPVEVVRAVYLFAARHPEVLSHVPCFCGCESRGHRHNDDCFVASRNARGTPTAWEPHGVG